MLWAGHPPFFAGLIGTVNPTVAQQVERSCPVTFANGSTPGKAGLAAGFNHGTGSLWVALWPRGRLLAGPLPDGSSWAEIRPDGSIDAKVGWWRGVGGQLTISRPEARCDSPA